MATTRSGPPSQRLARILLLVCGSTLVLSLAFFGLVAVLSTTATPATRLPFYVLAGAACFVAALLWLETTLSRGSQIIRGALGAGTAGFLLAALGVEGGRFVFLYPGRVTSSQVLPYVLAAALIATGLGIWTANHWRDVAPAVR
jgi:hypothetical protein